MEWTVDVTLKPQFVATTEAAYQGRRLHSIQRRFYEWDDLASLTLMTAPTGTGKSYAFPLPVIHKKEQGGLSGRRGVVIAPTNALIDEMCQVYQRDFGSLLRVGALNSKTLDDLDVHGPERWNGVLQILSDNDLIITNPDLLNFAIFGGYHRFKGVKGQLQFPELLAKVDYFVFDEYHLYDEEQIANVLAYIMLQQELIGGRETKYIFASATPEKKLGLLFQDQGWTYEEIIEPVLETVPADGRMIHGEVAVHFRKATSIIDLVCERADDVRAAVERGERVLLIFDRLRDLQTTKSELRSIFPELSIAEDSGYMTRASNKDDLEQAHIILGTNKLEQGVNLDANFCIMQPGWNSSNFFQRFGRVARDGQRGTVYVLVEKIQELVRAFEGHREIGYYDFAQEMQSALQERKFYEEHVPFHLGAALFAVEHGVSEFNLRKTLSERLKPEGSARLIWGVMKQISITLGNDLWEANKDSGYGYSDDCKAWREWWREFLDTFRYFRGDTLKIKVRDLDYEQDGQTEVWREYRYDWLLLNKEILEKGIDAGGKPYLVVSGFREGKPEVQYIIPTLPIGNLEPSTNILWQKEKYALKKAFGDRLARILQLYSRRTTDAFSQKAVELVRAIHNLKPIFTEKRLKVVDVCEQGNIL